MPEQIWFSSDIHFNHEKLIKSGMRKNFANVGEMNEALIENWNSCVRRIDRVYLLGDVSLGDPRGTRKLLDALRGRIYLIRGNHDSIAENKWCRSRFDWIKDLHYFAIDKQKILLCHYAMRSWRSRHHGSYMLFGHSHGSLTDDPKLRSMDVGVDCHNLFPVSWQEVNKKLKDRPYGTDAHHGKSTIEMDR